MKYLPNKKTQKLDISLTSGIRFTKSGFDILITQLNCFIRQAQQILESPADPYHGVLELLLI
jgi:hypothetical protein